ncbi:hypothetical protein BGZ70_001553 [Mortierella alpina]|uniref:Uncharacterized protein n=1 Tax=Mortierella alpina TaxID=64518 RepID=A0A9P6IVN9_MORAP|nr:hypothetical protein BGZ70_001553 [Mortierella alpina]
MNEDSLARLDRSPGRENGDQVLSDSIKTPASSQAEQFEQHTGPGAPDTNDVSPNTVAAAIVNTPNDAGDSNDCEDEAEEEEDEEEDDDEEEEDFEDEESDDEQDEMSMRHTAVKNSKAIARPAYLCEPEESKVWDVLNGDHPVAVDLLKQIPGWRTMIDSHHLWQELAVRNEMGQPGGNIATYKDLVLGQMVAVCDVCLDRSKDYGIHLPLPVQRPDLLGLVWMCKRCRDNYGATHPEVMSSRAAQEDDVFVQEPQTAQIQQRLQPVYRHSHYRDFGYRYHDDFSEFDSESDDEYDDEDDFSDDSAYDYQMRTQKVWTQWTNKKDQRSWLNQHLRNGRQRMMQTLLGIHRLQIRADSRLCNDFIGGCAKYNPYVIADVMAEMAWFFGHTRYTDFCRQSPEAGKVKAIAHWAKDLIDDSRAQECERQQSFESLKNGSAPPKSLWPKVLYAFETIRRVEDERIKKDKERRADLEARVKAREERKKEANDTEEEANKHRGGEGGADPIGASVAEKGGAEDDIEDAREDDDIDSVHTDDIAFGSLDVDLDLESITNYWGSDFSRGYLEVQSALSSKFSFKVDVDIKDH